MNRSILKYLILLFSAAMFIMVNRAHAQEPELLFEHLSVAEGLPHTSVYNILQDPQGFMWFATEDGLAKYDGYKFTVYKQDPTDPKNGGGDCVG